jgi:hypothetical protein
MRSTLDEFEEFARPHTPVISISFLEENPMTRADH